MIGRIVTCDEIETAISEMMPDDTTYEIVATGGGGFFVRINDSLENVLLRDAATFYQKLNDYCVRIEQDAVWDETDRVLQERYPFLSGD
jgi:hypothetical protein